MPILIMILKFVGVQLLQAVLTAQLVKDAFLAAFKAVSKWTKSKWDDKIYKRVKFYMTKDTSERFKADSDQQ